MTYIKNGILVIESTKDDKCELCGKVSELRPYGPNGENICFECGMKNEIATAKQFDKLLDKMFAINPNHN